MPRLPLSISKAMDAWRQVSASTEMSASITLAGDRDLIARAEEQFSTGGTTPGTWVKPLVELTRLSSVPGEVLVVFTSPAQEEQVVASVGRPAPKGGVVIAVDEGAAATGRLTRPCLHCMRVSFSDTPVGWQRLYAACAELVGDHVVALGRRYPVLREAAARRVIYRTAGQNALIGLVFFLPGADLPPMTLNQIKMILSIATMYGVEVNQERAVELVGVLGLSFGFRALARVLARNMPGVGFVVKAGTGFTATMALGLAAVQYFQKGAPASTSRLVALAGSFQH